MIKNKNLSPELPKGWAKINLEDYIYIAARIGWRGLKKEEYTKKGLLLLAVRDIRENGTINYNVTDHLSEFRYEESPEIQLKNQDILITKDGTIGRVGFVENIPEKTTVNSSILVVRPCSAILPKFLFYYFRGPKFQEIVRKKITGTAVPHLFQHDIKKFQLDVSPLPEQHRIIAKIEELFTKLDAGVDTLKKVKAQLKRYRMAVLKHVFEGKLTEEWRKANKGEIEPASVLLERIKEERKKSAKGKCKELPPVDTSGLPELPEGWVWAGIAEICDLINGRAFKPSEWSSKGLPIIRIQNLNNTNASFNYCNFEVEDKYLVNNEQLLFAWSGTPGTSFGAHIWNRGRAVLNQHIFKMEINESCISKIFLKHLINHNVAEYIRKSHGTAGLAHITKKKFENSLISLPPPAEQHKIVKEIERHFSRADEVEKVVEQSIKRAERLRQSILKKAFEGELVPQDPSDEAAEKLLERTSAEKVKRWVRRKVKRRIKGKRVRKKKG